MIKLPTHFDLNAYLDEVNGVDCSVFERDNNESFVNFYNIENTVDIKVIVIDQINHYQLVFMNDIIHLDGNPISIRTIVCSRL